MGAAAEFQTVMTTHSPLSMACPSSASLRIQGDALLLVKLEDADYLRPFRDFCGGSKYFVDV